MRLAVQLARDEDWDSARAACLNALRVALDRAAVRAFLAARGESWRDDPSNDNPRFERVRIRARGVLPDHAGKDRALLSRQAANPPHPAD